MRSRQVISSGGVEPVADGGAEGHSLFAFYLIDALRRNDREVIDLENLFHTKVWKPVTEIGDQRPNVGRLKTPMDQDGQFVLYNTAWVKEQAGKQAALEAEKQRQDGQQAVLEAQKQKQADQKTAVAVAELELQRQRIEMEKQKLAYEKEQLTQQQALNMEQLKLEQQKQKVEYAKLQAQLKAMEGQGKASELPAIVDAAKVERLQASVGQDTLNSQRTTQNRYRLSLFPVKFVSSFKDSEKDFQKRTVKMMASLCADNEKFEFSLSFKGVEGLSDKVQIFSDIANRKENQVWMKKSIFSQYEPDWEQMKKVGKKINADVAVLISVKQDTAAKVDVYLYDFRHEKAYSKIGKSISYNAVSVGVRQNVSEILKEFYRHQ